MRFTNLTRGQEIGANSYLLEIGGKRLVLDSGLHPVREGYDAAPDFAPLAQGGVDAVFVSHAHQDHLGSLPILQRHYPEAPVYMSEPTAYIAEAMLHNSVSVMMRKREEQGTSVYPLFTHREADRCSARWATRPYRKKHGLDGERADTATEASFEFFDAGHILGSVGTLFREGGRSLFYTGDINVDDQTLSRAADLPQEPIDVLVMETTRGDNPQKEGFSRSAEEERFLQAILDAVNAGQPVLVPVFALGKTQEILLLLQRLARCGKLQNSPVYIGGLSTRITSICDRFAHESRRQQPGLELLEVLAPYTITSRTLPEARLDKGRIYALSAGMLTEKTLSNALARRMLSRQDCHIFFVGYADPASAASRIKRAKPGDEVVIDEDFPAQPLRCQVRQFDFSGHASRESLLEMAIRMKPSTVVLVHGSPPAVEWFRASLAAALPGTRIVLPEPGVACDL